MGKPEQGAGPMTVRWYHRLAAWICESLLHPLATVAWSAQVPTEEDEERAWEEARRETEMLDDIYHEGYRDGYQGAETQWRER